MLPLFKGKTKDGKLSLADPDKFKKYVYGLGEREVELTLGKFREGRSLNSNNFYHGVVLPIMAEAIGELDPEELCQDLRRKFLSYKKVVKGKERTYVFSTASLDKDAMRQYLDKVLQIAAEMGVLIPDENEIKLTQ